MTLYLTTFFAILQTNAQSTSNMQHYTNLIEVIIWPLTVLIALLLFKKQINKIRVGKIKIDKAGIIEANFLDDAIASETSEKFGYGLPQNSNSSGDSSIKAKKSTSIKNTTASKKTHAESPRQSLLELEAEINIKLRSLLNDVQQDIAVNSNFAMVVQLSDSNIITSKISSQLKSVLELISIGLTTQNLTTLQVNKIKTLYSKIVM